MSVGARVRSVDDYPPTYRTVELQFEGFLFRIIAPQGVYNASGQTELGLSMTLWEGDQLHSSALMG